MVELTGARESNAGDDFHFNWAAKKSLKLLEPNTDLQAIYVEGASCSDNKLFEDDESVLLSIDISEYFGSSEFATATVVVFSQLKYSTRRGMEIVYMAGRVKKTHPLNLFQ